MSLAQQLSTLEQADLIRLATTQPEIEYLFRHALLQESAYQSFLRTDRQRVHRLVGEVLEQLYAKQPDKGEVAPLLARHFDEAHEPARALPYYVQAADAAMARYALTEAIALLSRALACAEHETAGADTWQHLYATRGRALELNGQFPQALANYQAMGAAARRRGDRHAALAAFVLEDQLYATATPLFNPEQAERHSEAALVEARALDDRPAEAKILWNRLNLYRFTLRMRLALESGERSLAIARELGLHEQLALTLNDLVHVYAHSGQWPTAKVKAVEVQGLWRQMGNLPMLADSLTTSAMFGNVYGELDMALAHAAEALALSITTSNLWGQAYSLSVTSLPTWYRGDPGRALALDKQAIRMGDLAGFQWPRIVNRAQMALIYCQLGDPSAGLTLAREALDWADHNLPLGRGFPAAMVAQALLAEGKADSLAAAEAALGELASQLQEAMVWELDPVLGARTTLALARGDGLEALANAQEHVARLRSMGLRLYLPEAVLTLARCELRLGQAAQAAATLAEARAEAEAMNLPMVEWQILAMQAEMARAAGRLAEAQGLRIAAHGMVQAIAERVPAPELRRSFLARPDVQALSARA